MKDAIYVSQGAMSMSVGNSEQEDGDVPCARSKIAVSQKRGSLSYLYKNPTTKL